MYIFAATAAKIVRLYDVGLIEWWFGRGKTTFLSDRPQSGGVGTGMTEPAAAVGSRRQPGVKPLSSAVAGAAVPVDLSMLGRRIRVARAPAPDTILWGNLPVPASTRRCRLAATTCLTVVAMLVALAFVYGANLVSSAAHAISGLPDGGSGSSGSGAVLCNAVAGVAAFNASSFAVYPAGALAAAYGNSPSVLAAALLEPAAGAVPVLAVPSALLQLVAANASRCGAAYAVPSDLLATYNASSSAFPAAAPYADAVAYLLPPCNGNATAAAASLLSLLDQASACPVLLTLTSALANCYCQAQLVDDPQALFQPSDSGGSDTSSLVPSLDSPNAACTGWLVNYGAFTGLLVLSSLVQVSPEASACLYIAMIL